jgi:hypothetical protein
MIENRYKMVGVLGVGKSKSLGVARGVVNNKYNQFNKKAIQKPKIIQVIK